MPGLRFLAATGRARPPRRRGARPGELPSALAVAGLAAPALAKRLCARPCFVPSKRKGTGSGGGRAAPPRTRGSSADGIAREGRVGPCIAGSCRLTVSSSWGRRWWLLPPPERRLLRGSDRLDSFAWQLSYLSRAPAGAAKPRLSDASPGTWSPPHSSWQDRPSRLAKSSPPHSWQKSACPQALHPQQHRAGMRCH